MIQFLSGVVPLAEMAGFTPDLCTEMISAIGEVRVSVMVELCQRVLDGAG